MKSVAGDRTRSTKDRLKETLFNMLGPHVVDARCLDAFAGSGALGVEASSRGAAIVDFVECDPVAFDVLNANIDTLGLDGASVFRKTAEAFMAATSSSYDLIFLDPPYESDLLGRALTSIAERGLLVERGLIVALSPKTTPLHVPEVFSRIKERHVGITTITFLEWRD